jgi:hypothetical protein
MKRKITILSLTVILIVLSSFSGFAKELIVFENTSNLSKAKEVIEKYIEISMKQYDTKSKFDISYDGIIKKDSGFGEYAKKLSRLIYNRYKSFDSLQIEKFNYNIEYGDVKNINENYEIKASVLEEKYYKGQDEPAYLCTEHIFTIEHIGNYFYIKHDKTDDYIDQYLQEEGIKDNYTIDDMISDDKKLIKQELAEQAIVKKQAALAAKTQSLTSEAKSVNSELAEDSDYTADSEKSKIKVHKFSYDSMYKYAGKYNKNSPNKVANRNPNYPDFEKLGGDCTNYISQILHAGGSPKVKNKWYCDKNTHTASWSSVQSLYKFIKDNKGVGPRGYKIKNDETFIASKGDIIQLRFINKSNFSHSVWITSHHSGTTSATKIAAHSRDRWNDLLESIPGVAKRRWIKLTGYGKE